MISVRRYPARVPAPRRLLLRVISLVVSMLALTGLTACQSSTTVTAHSTLTPLQAWLRLTPMEIAHRGGDADGCRRRIRQG